MKKILLVIIIFFSLPVLANDIKDFEIGPISLGQSLLDYTDKNQIESLKSGYQYPNNKYIRYEISKIVSFENFDYVDVMVKNKNQKYIIEGISASIYYDELSKCLEIKSDTQKNVENILKADDIQETKFPSKQDKTGESIIYGIQYYTKPYPSQESIIINCYHMTKKSNIKRVLKISVNNHEFAYFIVNDSYN